MENASHVFFHFSLLNKAEKEKKSFLADLNSCKLKKKIQFLTQNRAPLDLFRAIYLDLDIQQYTF